MAYGALDAAAGSRLTTALLDIVRRSNRAKDGTVVVPAEYLEVVVSRA